MTFFFFFARLVLKEEICIISGKLVTSIFEVEIFVYQIYVDMLFRWTICLQ